MIKEQFENILFNTSFASSTYSSKEIKAISDFTIFFQYDFNNILDYDQMAPHHDRDLWKHTATVMSGIPIFGKKYNLTKTEEELLTIVGFFHDFGKPNTMTEKKYDKVPLLPDNHPSRRFQTPTEDGLSTVTLHSFMGHAAESSRLASFYLDMLGYPRETSKLIKFYIAHHDDYMRIRDINKESISNMAEITLKLIQDAQKTEFPLDVRAIQLLMLIGKCDAAAQATYIYEFNTDTNSFPPISEPSDTLTRKIETYEDIEIHFPDVLNATDKLIVEEYQKAIAAGEPNATDLYGNQRNLLRTIQEGFRGMRDQSMDLSDEGPSFE